MDLSVIPPSAMFSTTPEHAAMRVLLVEDAAKRANRRWKKALADYEPPPLDEAVDDALKDFISRKKAEMQDAWY